MKTNSHDETTSWVLGATVLAGSITILSSVWIQVSPQTALLRCFVASAVVFITALLIRSAITRAFQDD